jgi:hypothetical protein
MRQNGLYKMGVSSKEHRISLLRMGFLGGGAFSMIGQPICR